MKIIRPYAKLLEPCGDIDPMKRIEWCARISHRSEETQTEDSWKRFIENVVLKHGDWSVVEHVSATVDSITDRGITHESVRHRLFSYTQESTRFVNYEKKMPPAFIYPQVGVECEQCIKGNVLHSEVLNFEECRHYFHLSGVHTGRINCLYDDDWLEAIDVAEKKYIRLITVKKWRPQEARSVFPNALASRIITTGNLRMWRHYFIMRTTQEAHPQMRQVSIPLLDQFKQAFPILFDDIQPNNRQVDNLRLPG